MSNLRILNLDSNDLKSLPNEIGQLGNLCDLDLERNDLSHLPNGLGSLTRLSKRNCSLHLYDNPLITPPREVIEQGTPAILAYLRNQALWHMKKMIAYAASVVGFLALVILGLRWRYLRLRRGKKKRI